MKQVAMGALLMGVENTSVVSAPEGRMISLYDIDIQARENVSTLLAISSKFRHFHEKPIWRCSIRCVALSPSMPILTSLIFLAIRLTCQIGLSNT